MTSAIKTIKQIYAINNEITLNEEMVFKFDCLERMGKQWISIIISAGLINASIQPNPTAKQLSSTLKRFEPSLINKLSMKSQKELYRSFGLYIYENIDKVPDCQMVQLELMLLFIKNLTGSNNPLQKKIKNKTFAPKATSGSNFSQSSLSPASEKSASTLSFQSQSSSSSSSGSSFSSSSSSQSSSSCSGSSSSSSFSSRNWTSVYQHVQDLKKQVPEVSFEKKQHAIYNSIEDQYDQTFEFGEKTKPKIDLTKKHMIEVINYLEKLSSPQGQLTYIWQHLKWPNFTTSYPSQMNPNGQWLCTAAITLPPSLINEKLQLTNGVLSKYRLSVNKRKARQLACMDLLKSLYLLYPEVWLTYKHLRQEKKLVIPPMDSQKDEDQLEIIRSWNFDIDIQKIQRLSKNGKGQIRKKIQSISAKAQLNTLLQQLPGRITSPKLERKLVQGGKWSVPVKIEYKTDQDIIEKRDAQVFEKTVIYSNTKVAQEQAYMQAIIEMYQKNPDLFEKIQCIKLAKGIQDPQKKLPILRYNKNKNQPSKWLGQLIT